MKIWNDQNPEKRLRPFSNKKQWHQNVFEDTKDKTSSVLNLMGTTFKNVIFLMLCPKIWLGHVPISPYVPAPLKNLIFRCIQHMDGGGGGQGIRHLLPRNSIHDGIYYFDLLLDFVSLNVLLWMYGSMLQSCSKNVSTKNLPTRTNWMNKCKQTADLLSCKQNQNYVPYHTKDNLYMLTLKQSKYMQN